jgi:hypothetical protein
MPDFGERIVFCVEVDQPSAAPASRFECGVDAVSMAGDSEPLLFNEVADGIVGSVLLIGRFGMGPDLGRC